MAVPGPTIRKSFTIGIIGGGLGGVILAIALMEHGIPFHIYESGQRFAEIGAGVSFGPNAVTAMRLISPDLFNAFSRHATVNTNADQAALCFSVRRGTKGADNEAGELLFNISANEELLLRTGLPTRCCVHRAQFLDELVRLLPPNSTTFGKTVSRLGDLDHGDVKIHFSDCSSAVVSAVVGCDGIHSSTRCSIGEGIQPVFAGEYVYRALVPYQTCQAILGEEVSSTCQIYTSHGAYILMYPVESGQVINVVAARTGLNGLWEHSRWNVPTTDQEFRQDFAGWPDDLINLVASHRMGDRWALFDLRHNNSYCRRRVCILGDAAHATTPHMGAGAGMAIEDAYILSNLLAVCQDQSNIPAAFHAYDHVRRPRSQEVISLSTLSGNILTYLDTETSKDLGLMEDSLNSFFNRLWDHDLVPELSIAKGIMRGNSGNP